MKTKIHEGETKLGSESAAAPILSRSGAILIHKKYMDRMNPWLSVSDPQEIHG